MGEQRNVAITVKKVPEKAEGGYGFAAVDGASDSDVAIFVHAVEVGNAGIRPAEVRVGDRYIADIVTTHKGLRATNLQKPW